ncbi:hypothetical protein [Pleionea mediterranea]|uniref:Lipoprotein n=1 Tax=Pleionea mediterranea TaxID=523701 RepID=A0A316FZS5_9GAMM|nr:hypothetical protein [Pleionea mediterranea]PWK53903.1 hypothetical protein C8D97_102293 [Pleionea mediterranea]
MKFIKLWSVMLLSLLLIGCGSMQKPIPITKSFYNNSGKTIGVLHTQAPEAETHYTGSIGLLDYAIIAGVNSDLDKHLRSLSFTEYKSFINSLKPELEKKGFKVVLIESTISIEEAEKLKSPSKGISQNDFSKYKEQFNLDFLMLIQMHSIGTTRSYYGPAPTSEPVAMTNLTGQIVDLNTNTLQWYSNINSTKIIPAPWDEEESNFPNLTNAVYQALNDSFRMINIELNQPKEKAVEQVTPPTE